MTSHEYLKRVTVDGLERGVNIFPETRQMATYGGALFRGVVIWQLSTFYELSNAEIARRLNVTGGTVRHWLKKVNDYISINDDETLELLKDLMP